MKNIDFTGISVYVERNKAHPVYEQLVSRASKKAEDFPFATMKDLFMVAACVGAQHGCYEELGTKRDIFSGELFSAKTDVPVLAALAYHHIKDVEIISDPKQVIEIAQCWANGGIFILRDELLANPGLGPLYNFIELIL